MRFLLISFLIIDTILYSVLAAAPAEKDLKVPPVYRPLGDYSDPNCNDDVDDDCFETLWDADIPRLTKRAKECKDVLYDLRESGNDDFEQYALAVSEFSWAYIPLICTEPKLDAYKTVIDAWASYNKDCGCGCDDLVKALRNLRPSLVEALNLALDSAAINSGCLKDDPCKDKKSCKSSYEVTKYDTTTFWDTTGWIYPCKVQQCAKDLAKSNRKINNLTSLMYATFAIPPMLVFEESLDPGFRVQVFNMAGTDPIDSDFCEAFTNDIKSLKEDAPLKVRKAMRKALLSTKCIPDKEEDE